MKYYNGYPETVEIGSHQMNIHDVEHLILELSGEDNIHPGYKRILWENYTKVRVAYWDAQFEMTEEWKAKLNELGDRLISQMEEMHVLQKRLFQQELGKKKNGKQYAKFIKLQVIIKDCCSEDASDEEVDLYSELFNIQRIGYGYFNTYIEEEEYDCRKPEYSLQKAEDGILTIVHDLKEDANLAWKDLTYIGDFGMKVKYYY